MIIYAAYFLNFSILLKRFKKLRLTSVDHIFYACMSLTSKLHSKLGKSWQISIDFVIKLCSNCQPPIEPILIFSDDYSNHLSLRPKCIVCAGHM